MVVKGAVFRIEKVDAEACLALRGERRRAGEAMTYLGIHFVLVIGSEQARNNVLEPSSSHISSHASSCRSRILRQL